jgi:tetratricopeptide (TPR) repeat protein
VEKRGRRSTWMVLTLGTVVGGLIAVKVTAGAPTLSLDAGWREPLDRAEAALAQGQAQRAERAWEEAQRAVMHPGMPPTGLVNVGLAYLRIGEAAHDRQTAVARARQLFLRALFRARHNRDAQGLTEVSHAFALLGDCEVAERAYAVVLTMKPKEPPPACGPLEVSASPGSPRRAPAAGR